MPILIIPGAFTRASSFTRLAERLDATVVELPVRSRRLPQLDLGGLESSDSAVDKALRGVRATDPDGPLVLVGHSMGGLLSLRASERHELDALVLLMPAPPDGLLRHLARLVVSDPLTAASFASMAVSTWPIRAGWVRSAPRGLFTDAASAATIAESTNHRVDESIVTLAQLVVGKGRPLPVDIPTLVVGGTDDGLVPPERSRRLADQLGADYQELPVGHAFSEEPAGTVVDELVSTWISQHVPRSVAEDDARP